MNVAATALVLALAPLPWVEAAERVAMALTSAGSGFAKFSLGDIEVIAIRDGHAEMSASLLRQEGDRPLTSLPVGVAQASGEVRLSVNTYVIVENGRNLLIDTGASDTWVATTGSLLDSLSEAGIARESIVDVALTHTHADHVNGLIAADGSDAFPNLQRIFVPAEESSIFESSGRLARLHDKVVPMNGDFRISDQVTAVKAIGHSPGHTAYEIRSGDLTLLIWGDAMHVPSVQFSRPEITWGYDADQPEARSARLSMLERLSRPSHYVAGMHLDFPGIGQVTRSGSGFAFSPIE